MSEYIAIAVCAWLLYGVAFSIRTSGTRPGAVNRASPVVQTSYTGALSAVVFFLFASFAPLVSLRHFLLDLACGATFLAAQFCLYKSLAAEAGDSVLEILPVLASLTPSLTLVFVSVFLHLKMSNVQFSIFAALVLCMVAVQFLRRNPGTQVWAMAASLCAAAYCTLAKASLVPFTANVAYVSLGALFGSFFLLISRNVRTTARSFFSSIGQTVPLLTVLKGVLAVVSVLVLGYALGIGNPAFVSALQIVEYVAVLALTSIFVLNLSP